MQKDLHDNRLVVKIGDLPRLAELELTDGTRQLYNLRPKADKRGMYLNKVERHLGRPQRQTDLPR